MKNLWKVALCAIALFATLLVLWGCGGDKKEEDPDEKPGGGPHTCVGETWVTEREATCLAEGSKKLVCSCGKTVKTEVIPLGNHNVVNGVCTGCGSSFIEIRTVEDLQNVASNLKGTYVLMNDLDLGGMEWTPIGTFTGIFEGNGHVVSNFKITGDMGFAGLFGYNEGTIQNLGLENFTIDVSLSTGYGYAGGLVGRNSNGTITNCYAIGDISSIGLYSAYAGGLVGSNEKGTITNCYATGYVSSTSSDSSALAGGLAGFNSGTITNSYASGDVKSANSGSYNSAYAGGLVGNNSGAITNSYATGDVSSTSSKDDAFAGGLVGCNNVGPITNCYATGAVSNTTSGKDASVGGLVGRNWNGPITNCYATGDVVSSKGSGYDVFVGGLVGFGGPITNCYRYSEQSFTVTNNGTTKYSATNTRGTATDMPTLQSVDFQKNTLLWSADDWNFVAGAHPTLK